MNKKGQIFHYLIFVMLGALGFFLILSGSLSPEIGLRGKWHLNFLHDAVYEAEVDLLELDQKARDFGYDTALQLASNGGMISSSDCGTQNKRQLWNRKDKWCIENIRNIVSDLYKEHFKPARTFTEILFSGNFIIGKSGKKTIIVPGEYKQEYTYNYDFNVDIGYNFAEYALLEEDARALVTRCRNEDDLLGCLDAKPDYWVLCEDKIDSRQVAFCINSPHGAVIKGKSLIYELALDFEKIKEDVD